MITIYRTYRTGADISTAYYSQGLNDAVAHAASLREERLGNVTIEEALLGAATQCFYLFEIINALNGECPKAFKWESIE